MVIKDVRFYMGLKTLFVILILTISFGAGIVLGINEQVDSTVEFDQLEISERTIELGFEPIEIPSMRSAVSKTYDNGDGSYKSIIYIKPIHYTDSNGDWQDIDENLPSYGTRSRETEVIQPDGSAGKDAFYITRDGLGQDCREFNVGADQNFWMTLDSGQISQMRIIIQFNLGSIPSYAEINSAQLSLNFYNDANSNQDAFTIQAYAVTSAWVEGTGLTSAATQDGVCWNRRDATNTWSNPGGDYESTSAASAQLTTYGWYSWDLTNLVKEWHAGTKNNYGVVLIGTSGADAWKYLRSSDYTTAEDRPKLELDYITNRVPKIENYVPSIIMKEDDPNYYLELDGKQYPEGIFKDPDEDQELEFSIWNGIKWTSYATGGQYESENLTATVQQNGTLEIMLKPNRYGTDIIRLNATDPRDASVIHQMSLEIESVNDPPTIYDTTKWSYDDPEPSYSIGTLTCEEDQWANFTVKAKDNVEPEDNAKLKFSVNSTEDYASFFTIETDTGDVSFKPTNADVGIYYLMITVDDTHAKNNIDEYTFTLEIENVNDVPIITEISTFQFSQKIDPGAKSVTLTEALYEDTYFNFTVYGDDEDLGLVDSIEHIKFSIMPSTRFQLIKQTPTPEKYVKYSFLPTNDDVGVFTSQLSVSDRDSADTTLELKFNVRNVNDPPLISTFYFGTQIKDLDLKQRQTLDLENLGQVYTATEKIAYTFSVKGIDIDANDELEFDVEVQNRTKNEQKEIIKSQQESPGDNPNEVSNSLELTLVPDLMAGRVGEMWLNISVSDRMGTEGLLMLRIPVENINDPPPSSTIDVEIVDADRSTREKENLSVIFTAKSVDDPDGDFLNYSWDFDYMDGIGEDAVGEEVVWKFQDEGEWVITLTVDDGNGGTNTTTKRIQVLKPPEKGGKSDDGGIMLGSVGGIPIIFLILLIIIIVILVAVAMVMQNKKKKKEQEEAAAREAEQAQMMAAQAQFGGYPMAQDMGYYQDPAMMAQYQAYQQQMMMQSPEYQQMMAQYYDQTGMQPMDYQQYPEAGTGMDVYGQPTMQSMPMETATLAEGQGQQPGLPATGMGEQAQLPPYQLEEPAEGAVVEEQQELPVSPFADAQTQSMEEELGPEGEVSEVPIEPDTSVPEPEVAPELAGEAGAGEIPEPVVEAPEPEAEETAEGEGEQETEAAGPKCKNCGSPVKEGWFLCPECKQPLI
ncbi:DNRLRE domain-containing protein [[Eubacterium] cellulosolvens]